MRRAIRAAGAALIVLGLLFLVWGGVIWRWGDPVTGLYTRFEQRRLASELEERERLYARHPAATGTTTAASDGVATRSSARSSGRTNAHGPDLLALRRRARQFHDTTGIGDPVGRIAIAHLGLHVVVAYGTDSSTLRSGPGIDPHTFLPGEGELVYIAGHRTTFGAPFANIDELDRGDDVVLTMPYGTFRYRITHSVIVPADDLDRLRSHGSEVLALQACYPRFSARQRLIVYAKPLKRIVR